MYYPSSSECSMPNSESPMLQSDIDGQNAFIASLGTAFDDGDDAINSLIQTLGGNPAGDTSSGAAGVPTTGTIVTDAPGIPTVPVSASAAPTPTLPTLANPSSWAWAPSPAVPSIVPGGGSGFRAPKGEQQTRRRYGNQTAAPSSSAAPGVPKNCPIIIPLVTTIPVPPEAPVYPSSPVAPVAAPQAPLASGPAATPVPDCRTGNWCIDIMNGCVLDSQVSQQQLMACSEMGYAGNRNLFPAIAAAGGVLNGQYFGTPEPNPPQYEGSGMSGFGQSDAAAVQAANSGIFSSAIESVITGLVAAAALAVILKGRKKS